MTKQSADSQLTALVAGNPVHDYEAGQCCPDFSCCRPDLLAPLTERELFRDRPEIRDQMLMGFLGRALAGYGDKVHIAGSFEGEA